MLTDVLNRADDEKECVDLMTFLLGATAQFEERSLRILEVTEMLTRTPYKL
jgi:hypothetical protein